MTYGILQRQLHVYVTMAYSVIRVAAIHQSVAAVLIVSIVAAQLLAMAT